MFFHKNFMLWVVIAVMPLLSVKSINTNISYAKELFCYRKIMCACKCMRPGPITSNGYLNFLREYRQRNCGLSPVETVRRGARAWNRLTCEQKKKFRRMGCKRRRKPRCPKKRKRRCPRPRKRRCGKKRKPRSRCRKKPKCKRKRKRSACPKKKCMRQGRITNNGYLNFLRWYRKCHCGLSPQETVKRGARKWCSLPSAEKRKFSRMGCKKKRRRRKPCRRKPKKKRRCGC